MVHPTLLAVVIISSVAISNAIDLNTPGCSQGFLEDLNFNISYQAFNPATNKTITNFAVYNWDTANTNITHESFTCSAHGILGWKSRTASVFLQFGNDSLALEWTLQAYSVLRKSRSITLTSVVYRYQMDEARFPLGEDIGSKNTLKLIGQPSYAWKKGESFDCPVGGYAVTLGHDKSGSAMLKLINISLALFPPTEAKSAIHCIENDIPNSGPTGNYVYKNKDGEVLVNVTTSPEYPMFSVIYEVKNDTSNKTEMMTNTFSPNKLKGLVRNVDGVSSNDSVTMTVTWTAPDTEDGEEVNPTVLTWQTTLAQKDGQTMITDMRATIPVYPVFGFSPNATELAKPLEADFGSVFGGSPTWGNESAFMCNAEVKADDKSSGITLMLQNVHITGYGSNATGTPQDCTEDAKTTPVPPATTTTVPPESWMVPATGKEHCIFLDAKAIQVSVTYKNATVKPTKNVTQPWTTSVVSVPRSAMVAEGSTCNWEKMDGADLFDLAAMNASMEQVLMLTWKDGEEARTLGLYFSDSENKTKAADGTKFQVFKVTFSGGFPDAEGGKVDLTLDDVPEGFLGGSSDHSISCSAFNASVNHGNITDGLSISFENAKVQAFANHTSTMSKEDLCPADQKNKTSDLIPIIVGACLAALVVIVLVAYLIGRARARRTGYESV